MEEIGFINGEEPEKDLKTTSVWNLTMIIAFFERIETMYSKLTDKDKKTKNHFMSNLVTVSKGKT